MSPIKRERNKSDSSEITEVQIPPMSPTVESPNIMDVINRLQKLEQSNKEKDEVIDFLKQEVKEAKGDMSDKIKDSKRRYGELPNGAINKAEPRKYKYNLYMVGTEEKVIVKAETIGRVVQYTNPNTGITVNEHNLHLVFHDGEALDVEYNDYIERVYPGGDNGDGDFVQYDDIEPLADGSKNYTFRTEKYGTFTINKK